LSDREAVNKGFANPALLCTKFHTAASDDNFTGAEELLRRTEKDDATEWTRRPGPTSKSRK
jgi:hypothetical protein